MPLDATDGASAPRRLSVPAPGPNPTQRPQGSLRRFTCDDLLRFNNINMDVLTETVRRPPQGSTRGQSIDLPTKPHHTTHQQYNMGFYLQYLATWPEYFQVEEAPHGTGRLTSYSALHCVVGWCVREPPRGPSIDPRAESVPLCT